jgi:histidyl-tRNA synthetase
MAASPTSSAMHSKLPPACSPADGEFGEVVTSGTEARPNYSVQNPLGPISGYTNYSPQEMVVVSVWKQKLSDIYRRCGFAAIELRPVEYADNLLKKGGVSKQIYGISRLQDGGLTKLGIPFDRTVPLAIFVAQNLNALTFPYLRFDIGYAFRGEHASRGRYRAFIQSDIDIIDHKLNHKSDAQVIATTIQALHAIEITDCRMYVNHIAIAKGFMEYAGIPVDKYDDALRIIDKLKPDNQHEVIDELVMTIPQLTPDRARDLLKQMSYEGSFADFEFKVPISKAALEGLDSLKKTEKYVIGMGVAPGVIRFRPSLVRGLDYYTGIVCETFLPGREKYGSIASGGRYDKLVDGFTTIETGLEGVGISIGLTRLFDVMKAEGRVNLNRQTSASVFIGYRTEDQFPKAVELATALRNQGISVELYTSDKVRIKEELNICNKKGIPFAALVMNDDELILKDMRLSAQEQSNQRTFASIKEFANAIQGDIASLK